MTESMFDSEGRIRIPEQERAAAAPSESVIVNAAMIGLTALFLNGFAVDGLWAGIGAAIVTGVVSWIAGAFIGGDEKRG